MVPDRILLILIYVVAGLCAIAILFAIGVLLLRGRNERVAAKWRSLEQRWQLLLLDVLAGEATPGLLQALVERKDEKQFLEFLSRFSRRVRGAEHDMLTELAHPMWPRVDRMFRSRTAETRAHAVQLASMLAEDVDEQIAPALNDPAPLVNMVAARALARRRSVGYLPAILERSARFGEWHPRYMSTMLAGVGASGAGSLRAALADASLDGYARMVAADALQRMQDLPAAEVAANVLHVSQDADVNRACIRLLAVVGQQEHIALIRQFATSEDESLRGAAAAAIGLLGNASDLPLLEAALRDHSTWVVLRAAAAIRQIGGAEALREAAARLPDDNPGVAEIREMAS